jgi:hypothetical protein
MSGGLALRDVLADRHAASSRWLVERVMLAE